MHGKSCVTVAEESNTNVSYRHLVGCSHTSHKIGGDMYETDRPSWTIADASRLLRVSKDALYDACASGQIPSFRIGNAIRIPSEALRMRYVPEPLPNWGGSLDLEQLELPLDPSCLVPVRRWRNTRELIEPWEYERKKYGY